MEKWLLPAKNERGAAAFTCVFMLVLLLAAVVPLILALLSNSALSVRTYRNEKLAERLALGGMESVFAYLRAYSDAIGVDRGGYLEAYPGFVDWSYVTPEQVPVRYKAEIVSKTGGYYHLRVAVEAGAGAAKRGKTVEYLFSPTHAGGPDEPEVVTDDSRRIVVESGDGKMYVGGQYSENNIVNAAPKPQENLSAAIGNAIDYYRARAEHLYHELIDTWLPVAAQASCASNCHQDAVWESWAANMPDPPALLIPSANYWDAIDVTFGSPTNPVVLIVSGAPNPPSFNNLSLTVYGAVIFQRGAVSNGMNLNVYGDVLFGAGMAPSNAFNITTHKLNGEGGNFYVLGDFTPNTSPNLNIAGDFYAKYVWLSNAARLNVGGKMIVDGRLQLQGFLPDPLTFGQDLLVESLGTCCDNRIVAGGDLLIEKNIEQMTGFLHFTAGGYVGVGGNIPQVWHTLTVNTGGGTTSLIVPPDPDDEDPEGSGGGGGSSPGGWNPVRVG